MLLFPAEPYAGKVPDSVYVEEMEAAQHLGQDAALLDFEALLEGDLRRALRWVPVGEGRLAVFRGWMMRPEVYARLHAGLHERGWTPIHTPEQYRLLHHLPESFAYIAPVSPRAVWLPAETPEELNREEARAALASFGDGAVIVKDYVKSRKHEWAEACFIPDPSDEVQAMSIIETFLARQGTEFQGGLVLRAFEPFVPLTQHSRSGMPLTREYRLFFLDGRVISATPYWEEGEDSGEAPPLEPFAEVAASIAPLLHAGRGAAGGRRVARGGTGRRAGGGAAGAAGPGGVLPGARFLAVLSQTFIPTQSNLRILDQLEDEASRWSPLCGPFQSLRAVPVPPEERVKNVKAEGQESVALGQEKSLGPGGDLA